jgi:GNAT superfamily N-acetyltransferase
MDQISYRLATSDDVRTLVSLRATFLAEVSGADAADPLLLESLLRFFSTSVPKGDFVGYFATVESRIVATGGLVFHNYPPSPKNIQGRPAYIMNMYTLPGWRGRGIGSEILRRLIDVARRQCRWVQLHAVSKARPIYAKAGFTPMDNEMRLDLGAG